ncbi:protein-disulfide reductase DsbD family protein [Jhaorihella thermophila]
MLTCAQVCIPQDFALSLDLGPGDGIDRASADRIAAWAARVPTDGNSAGIALQHAALETAPEPALVVVLRSDRPFRAPDIFPEMSEDTTFAAPDIRLGDGGRLLWARIPFTNFDDAANSVAVTVTDGHRAASLERTALGAQVPPPPYERAIAGASLGTLLNMAIVALIGGLILNVMPCVLPVLSVKLSSAMKVGAQGAARVRAGFLMASAGIIAFMWALAGVTLALRQAGLSVGWGIQFQNPVFLAIMTLLVVLFAANMFGLFEITLPQSWTSRLAAASGQPTFAGDFFTGAFAAVLATPCSAPFLGTAVAFALAGRPVDIFVIFTAMGLGLALPYFAVAARPGLVASLPKPGRWMIVVKAALGLLLAGTAAWLLWVLAGVGGRETAIAVTAALTLAVALLALRLPETGGLRRLRGAAVAGLAALAIAAPLVIDSRIAGASRIAEGQEIDWIPFDRGDIARRVSRGQIVFLDITADWCITCKANKTLVINRDPVAGILNGGGDVVPMQADWTRPDDRIARFLRDHGRYGIPFNAVYGPEAPDGVLLPEVLTADLVLDALRKAGGDAVTDLARAN